MARRVDGKALLWAAFFIIVIVALIDVIQPDSYLVDLFSGQRTQEGRIERAMRRAFSR